MTSGKKREATNQTVLGLKREMEASYEGEVLHIPKERVR